MFLGRLINLRFQKTDLIMFLENRPNYVSRKLADLWFQKDQLIYVSRKSTDLRFQKIDRIMFPERLVNPRFLKNQSNYVSRKFGRIMFSGKLVNLPSRCVYIYRFKTFQWIIRCTRMNWPKNRYGQHTFSMDAPDLLFQ